jgi:hypothetical protein
MEHLNEYLVRAEVDYRTERARRAWQPVVNRHGKGRLRRRLGKAIQR